MNSGESSGESSSRGRENGSASTDPERPHKKARFPWQIKGKHHLKNQTEPVTESLAATPIDSSPITPPPKSVTSISNKLPINDSSLTNLENKDTSKSARRLIWHGSGRPPLSPDGNPLLSLETVVSLAQSMIMRSVAGGSNHFDTSRDAVNNLLDLDLEPVPSSPITKAREARRLRKEEDKCIARWQAAQTVKGCFDNTLNSVLDSWMSALPPGEDRLVALDFAQIMDDLPQSNNNVENEAILMAINAYGLQNVPTVAGVPAIAPSEQLARTLASNIPICEDSDSSICSEDFDLSDRESYYPWPLDDPITQDMNQTQQSDKEFINSGLSCRQIQDNRLTNQPTPYGYRDNSHTTAEDDYEYEFMNTAVIQAIKSKGLMAAGTDFG